MRTSCIILSILMLTILTACVSHDATKLHVGMTRDEVIKIMGKPTASTVNGATELLLFQHDTEFKDMKPLRGADSVNRERRPLARFVKVETHTVCLRDGLLQSHYQVAPPPTRHDPPLSFQVESASLKLLPQTSLAENNAVRFLEVSPRTAKEGVPTEYTVRLSYSLATEKKANLVVNLVCRSPQVFAKIGNISVPKGSGEIELIVKVTPQKEWSEHQIGIKAVLSVSAEGGLLYSNERSLSFERGP